MSSYPPPNPPRKLERSRNNRVLGGVCAGVAKYLNMDVNLVRILTVVLSLFTGVPVVAYIVALFLMPEEQAAPYAGPPSGTAPTGPAGTTDPVWGPGGAPWDQAPGNNPPAAPSPQPGPAPQDASSTAAPEGPSVPDAEPVAETAPPEPAAGQESSWESTSADPQEGESSSSGETPPSGGAPFEGHKPTS